MRRCHLKNLRLPCFFTRSKVAQIIDFGRPTLSSAGNPVPPGIAGLPFDDDPNGIAVASSGSDPTMIAVDRRRTLRRRSFHPSDDDPINIAVAPSNDDPLLIVDRRSSATLRWRAFVDRRCTLRRRSFVPSDDDPRYIAVATSNDAPLSIVGHPTLVSLCRSSAHSTPASLCTASWSIVIGALPPRQRSFVDRRCTPSRRRAFVARTVDAYSPRRRAFVARTIGSYSPC
jgi:hypothetical protein